MEENGKNTLREEKVLRKYRRYIWNLIEQNQGSIQTSGVQSDKRREHCRGEKKEKFEEMSIASSATDKSN